MPMMMITIAMMISNKIAIMIEVAMMM